MTATASLDFFARSVRDELFKPQPEDGRRVGAEIEMLPMLSESGLPCPLESSDECERSTLAFLRPYGASRGWREHRSKKGAPYFSLPNGAMLTFEPGGQLELCTPARVSISALLRESEEILTGLRSAAAGAGISLVSVGIDPQNGIERVPLQLASERYAQMTRYFDSIGPFGVRMMRQTAATQISVDGGAVPAERWRLLADATPYLTALFANSSRYAGQETGWQSFRARCWRELDCSRTGVPHPEPAVEDAYTRFALDAIDMTRTDGRGEYRSFGDWASDGQWSEAQWENHLTTLFPEVRPRGHLEVRSIDAGEPDAVAAAVIIVAGIVYDPVATNEARSILSPADEDLLLRAAQCGRRDAEIGGTAAMLAEVGLRGAKSLGETAVGGADLERATEFVSRWTHHRPATTDNR